MVDNAPRPSHTATPKQPPSCHYCGTVVPFDAMCCPTCHPHGLPPGYRPTAPPALDSDLRTSVHPPEREPQESPPHAGGELGPGQALAIAAVQDQLDDHDRPIREPARLSTTFRHSGWARNRLLVYRSLCRTEQPPSRQTNFTQCGSDAYVLRSLDHPDCYRLAGSACHDRFCLPCAQERSHAVALNVIDLTAGRTIRFLTLTLKATTHPLSAQLDKLYSSFQALRRRKFWKDKVHGGVAFLEVTWSKTNSTWHPHFHILIEGAFVPYRQLRKAWYEITRDSFVIDIRPVRDQRTAARYVSKYVGKPFNNTFIGRNYQLDEAVLAFKGRKLCLTFGTWRGITLIRTPEPGAWEHVAPLESVITAAAHGDARSIAILRSLTDADLNPLFARAPPLTPPVRTTIPDFTQLTFFGAWQADASYIHPGINPQTTQPQQPARAPHELFPGLP